MIGQQTYACSQTPQPSRPERCELLQKPSFSKRSGEWHSRQHSCRTLTEIVRVPGARLRSVFDRCSVRRRSSPSLSAFDDCRCAHECFLTHPIVVLATLQSPKQADFQIWHFGTKQQISFVEGVMRRGRVSWKHNWDLAISRPTSRKGGRSGRAKRVRNWNHSSPLSSRSLLRA